MLQTPCWPFRVIQVLLDLGIVGMFVLFGYLGIKGYRWAVITG